MELLEKVQHTMATKYISFRGGLLRELNMPVEQLKPVLQQMRLNRNEDYLIWLWSLELTLLEAMVELNEYDDVYAIAQRASELWKERTPYEVSAHVMEEFLLTLFKTPNARKAFNELCEGDMEAYKVYTTADDVFVEYVVRTIIYEMQGKMSLSLLTSIFNAAYAHYFNRGGTRVVTDYLHRKELLYRKKELTNRLPLMVKRTSSYEKPYMEGVRTILQRVELDESSSPAVQQFYASLREVDEREDAPVAKASEVEEPESLDELDELFNTEHKPVEVTSPIEHEPEKQLQQERELQQLVARTPEQHIDDAIEALRESKRLLQQTPTEDPRIAIAQDEIDRLEKEIAYQKESVQAAKKETLTSLIRTIGGQPLNYFLSTMYRESVGETELDRDIMRSQLSDFFNELSMEIGLTVVNYGQTVGEHYVVDRHIIGKQYQLLGSIQSTEERVQVELVQYGWALNGETVVQPLLREVKGDA